jgi:hypothetical protein
MDLMPRIGTFAALSVLAIVFDIDAAAADQRRYARTQPDFVTAESRFGRGTITGAVRPARYGFEVRLPGGTWIGCRRSCSETLRVETLDFWENQGGRSRIDNEGGIFGPLTIYRRY